VLLVVIPLHGLENDEGEFVSVVKDVIGDVEEVVGIVVVVVSVVCRGKVFGDLWGVWLRIDVEEEEIEVVLPDEEEVVGDRNMRVSEVSVICVSWIGVVVVEMSMEWEWVPVDLMK
jgi:hypothetical protein